jgi:ATP-dependent Zn protease
VRWCLVWSGVGVSWMIAARRWSGVTKLTYSQFLDQVRAEQVASVIVFGSSSGATQATGRLVDGKTVRTVLPSNYRDALAAMQDKRVNVEIEDASSEPLRLFINATPFLLLLGVWMVLFFKVRKFPNGNPG